MVVYWIFASIVKCAVNVSLPYWQDEVISPCSLAFSLDGERLYAGFNKSIKVFHTSRPGRTCTSRSTYGLWTKVGYCNLFSFRVFIYSPADKKKGGQPGLISCIAMHPTQPGTFALGSYSCSGTWPHIHTYCIAGYFCMVEIFVYFVLKRIIQKLKLLYHNRFNVTILSCTKGNI